MYPQNSLVSLMANYHDSDDDEGADENFQNNLKSLNLTPSQSDRLSPGSLNGISNTNNNNHDVSNVPAQNLSFEKPTEMSNNVEIGNDILLPPEPTGSCALALQDKITELYQKIQAGQLDMNQRIQEHKHFRNPSIYEKLISFCNIDELGTNYPPDKFDPAQWPEDSFYDKLAIAQNEKMKKLLDKK